MTNCNAFDPTNCPRLDWKVPAFENGYIEPHIHNIFTRIFGWSYRNFVYIPDSVPEAVRGKYGGQMHLLSTWPQVLIGMVLYLTIVLGGREIMRNRPAFVLKWPFIVHNVILVLVSGVLLVCMLEILVPMIWKHGFQWSVCEPGAYDLRLVPFYYANYLVKWWEFIDTFFLVLKKKPLGKPHIGD
jgi:hypothetical protein